MRKQPLQHRLSIDERQPCGVLRVAVVASKLGFQRRERFAAPSLGVDGVRPQRPHLVERAARAQVDDDPGVRGHQASRVMSGSAFEDEIVKVTKIPSARTSRCMPGSITHPV